MRALATVALLIGSNCFMTWAWYGHLKRAHWTIPLAILISWLIALPEYILQVPANRIGHVSQGGPFSASQLKVIQEAITLCVFVGFSILVLKEKPRANEYIAFVLIFAGVAVAMLGRSPGVPSPAAPIVAVEPPGAPEAASPPAAAAADILAHGATAGGVPDAPPRSEAPSSEAPGARPGRNPGPPYP